MAGIDKDIAQKIKASAKITDVIESCGIQLRRKGANYECLCPFHDDRHLGNFVVNVRDNYYKCFSCEAAGDPIKFLMEYEKMTYPDALRYIASMYNIYIDDEPAPKITRKYVPREPAPERIWMYWKMEIVKRWMHHTEDNNLLQWMLNLPMPDDIKHNLRNMIELYFVGTSLGGYTKGWVAWPEVDMKLRLYDIKFMKYQEDGHRDKAWNPNWFSSLMASNGLFDNDKYKARRTLFGLHLAYYFKDAEVCLVESEKTALLCSAFSDPNKKIWMATGGMRQFKPDMLDQLIEANRYIVLYPDVDGEQQWMDMMKAIGYSRMSMTANMRPVPKGLYNPTLDGPKADIADIMIRLMNDIEETPAQIAARRLGKPDKAPILEMFMNVLGLSLKS